MTVEERHGSCDGGTDILTVIYIYIFLHVYMFYRRIFLHVVEYRFIRVDHIYSYNRIQCTSTTTVL